MKVVKNLCVMIVVIKKDVRTVKRTGQIFIHIKMVKCSKFVKNVLIKRSGVTFVIGIK